MADQTKLNWQSETFDLTTNLARLPIPSLIPDQTQSTTPAARLESSSHPMYRSVPVSSKFANHTIYKASMLIRTHSRRRLVLSATHSHPRPVHPPLPLCMRYRLMALLSSLSQSSFWPSVKITCIHIVIILLGARYCIIILHFTRPNNSHGNCQLYYIRI